ncbi:hypothetical protein LCGC14_2725220 [marine sediment metagenome]|uniref:Uncharacterized protein n=1 Tax=marine sediment metagenome TaxID=412755 RepID=A0A0F9BHY1_9ZZZZ
MARRKRKGTVILVGFGTDSPLARFHARQAKRKGKKVERIR